MISAQRDALEAARKSREDALKATKVRLWNFVDLLAEAYSAGSSRSKATFWLP